MSLDPPAKSGERKSFTVTYRGIPRSWPPDRQEPAWRANVHQRELAQQGSRVAADDRPPLRQGDQRVHRHGARAFIKWWPMGCCRRSETSAMAGGSRTGRNRSRSPRGSTRSASPSSPRTTHGLVKGIPLEAWVYHQDRDSVVPAPRKAGPSGPRVLRRTHRAFPVREAGQRPGRGPQRRDRARQRDLLRRADRFSVET